MIKKINKSKRGMSQLVAYVIFIVIAISLSLGVYSWLKTYMVKTEKKCSPEVELKVIDFSCIGESIILNLRNRGNFGIDAVIITASNESRISIKYNLTSLEGYYFFNGGEPLGAGKNYSLILEKIANLKSLDIMPIKLIEDVPILCTGARETFQLEC